MPVRTVPKNHIAVTGRHATSKSIGSADFESTLENDYLILLDFDPLVDLYEVQPVRVPVPGVTAGYVPDVLVHFRQTPGQLHRPSELTEIKAQSDFDANAIKYAPKFAAAAAFAEARGWVFVCRSERDIRTPRLANLKFLRAYRRVEPEADDVGRLLEALVAQGGRSSSGQLLDALGADGEARAHVLPTLWHLVVTHRIEADLDLPFGADVPLWLPGLRP